MSKEKNFVKIKKSKNTNTIFGLPAKSYTDKNFWKKECETVLSNDWLFVGDYLGVVHKYDINGNEDSSGVFPLIPFP